MVSDFREFLWDSFGVFLQRIYIVFAPDTVSSQRFSNPPQSNRKNGFRLTIGPARQKVSLYFLDNSSTGKGKDPTAPALQNAQFEQQHTRAEFSHTLNLTVEVFLLRLMDRVLFSGWESVEQNMGFAETEEV